MRRSCIALAVVAAIGVLHGRTLAQARETMILASAPSVEWHGRLRPDDRRIVLQLGYEVVVLEVARNGRASVVRTASLPDDACLWDVGEAGSKPVVVAVAPEATHLVELLPPNESLRQPVRVWSGSDLFRGALSAAPLHRPLGAGGSRVVIPTLRGLDVVDFESGNRVGEKSIPYVPRSEQRLGWGLGYRMVDRLSVPWFTVCDVDGDGPPDVILKEDDRYRLHLGTATGYSGRVEGARAPAILDSEILDFTHDVPPIVTDFDRDGRCDLVVTSPGDGTVLCYRGSDLASSSGRPQVIKVAGWVLRPFVSDADGDGRADLVLVSVPRLGLLEQLRVFKGGDLPAILTVRRGREEGGFAPGPWLSHRFSIPIEIVITRNYRTFRLRSPLCPARVSESGPQGIVLPDAVGVRFFAFGEAGIEPGSALPLELADGEAVEKPFAANAGDVDGDGRDDLIVITSSSGGGPVRALLAPVVP